MTGHDPPLVVACCCMRATKRGRTCRPLTHSCPPSSLTQSLTSPPLYVPLHSQHLVVLTFNSTPYCLSSYVLCPSSTFYQTHRFVTLHPLPLSPYTTSLHPHHFHMPLFFITMYCTPLPSSLHLPHTYSSSFTIISLPPSLP